MNQTIRCPYCGNNTPLSNEYYKAITFDKNLNTALNSYTPVSVSTENTDYVKSNKQSLITLHALRCAICDNTILRISKENAEFYNSLPLLPSSDAQTLPDYIPLDIRDDYREAYDILYLSPKASATLSRRCLQNMLHDFWQIKTGNLYQEIQALEGKIDSNLFQAINGLRHIGNIGAHPDIKTSEIIDIDPNEAETLLKLIEILFEEWYINRHNKEQRVNAVINLKSKKHD